MTTKQLRTLRRQQETRHVTDERRRQLLTLLEERPGITFTRIMRAVKGNYTVAHRALDELEEEGLVFRFRHRNALHYFLGKAPQDDAGTAQLRARLLCKTDAAILALITNAPRTQTEAATALEIQASQAQDRMVQLEVEGLITRLGPIRAGVPYGPAPALLGRAHEPCGSCLCCRDWQACQNDTTPETGAVWA